MDHVGGCRWFSSGDACRTRGVEANEARPLRTPLCQPECTVAWRLAQLKHEYFRLGLHYYVEGRLGARAGLTTVPGNLLHHAVEMFLKGTLVTNCGNAYLKEAGHELSVLWREFKTGQKDSHSQFDDVLTDLNRFEHIRYPDFIVEEGLTSVISFGDTPVPSPEFPAGRAPPHYVVLLGKVDRLILEFFVRASLNPKAFKMLGDFGREGLTFANPVADRW